MDYSGLSSRVLRRYGEQNSLERFSLCDVGMHVFVDDNIDFPHVGITPPVECHRITRVAAGPCGINIRSARLAQAGLDMPPVGMASDPAIILVARLCG